MPIRQIPANSNGLGRRVGIVLSGRFGVWFPDGTTLEFGPDDVHEIPPGHDGYTIGDEPCVVISWAGLRAFSGFPIGSREPAAIARAFDSQSSPEPLAP
jgi:hypothetical protein